MSDYEYTINYGNIKYCDSSNGPGTRISIYFLGSRDCLGCNDGKKFTDNTLKEIVANLKEYYYNGVSILGEEPLAPKNKKDIFHIIDKLYRLTGKSIWLWTSYTFEYILKNNIIPINILKKIDVIVDGRFDINKKNAKLYYRGSSNQRVIDVQESLNRESIVTIRIKEEENI